MGKILAHFFQSESNAFRRLFVKTFFAQNKEIFRLNSFAIGNNKVQRGVSSIITGTTSETSLQDVKATPYMMLFGLVRENSRKLVLS